MVISLKFLLFCWEIRNANEDQPSATPSSKACIGFRSAICSDQNRKFLSEKKLIFLSNQFFSNKSNAIESAGA